MSLNNAVNVIIGSQPGFASLFKADSILFFLDQ